MRWELKAKHVVNDYDDDEPSLMNRLRKEGEY